MLIDSTASRLGQMTNKQFQKYVIAQRLSLNFKFYVSINGLAEKHRAGVS